MRSRIVNLQVAGTDVLALPPNPDRRAITVSAYGTTGGTQFALKVNFGQSALNGFAVLWDHGTGYPGGSPIPTLDIGHVGEQLKLDVHVVVVNNVGTTFNPLYVTILETFE